MTSPKNYMTSEESIWVYQEIPGGHKDWKPQMAQMGKLRPITEITGITV